MNRIETIGAFLAIAGSFLPWEVEGDFVSSWTFGIQLFPIVRDNGGVFIVMLTVIFIVLTIRPPKFLNNPSLWKLIVSAILMASSLLFVARWFSHRSEAPFVVGVASIKIGLVIVVIGSALLLWMAIENYRKVYIQNKSAG